MTRWVVMVIAACGNPSKAPPEDAHQLDAIVDASADAGPGSGACDPLAQTGCNAGAKCTWIIDDTTTGAGHTGCAFGGAVPIGGSCTRAANGVDDCVAGAVCTSWGDGTLCRQICDLRDVGPLCDATHGCITASAFTTSGPSPLAGICVQSCDPLDDNDFDGSGSALTRAGSACGSDLTIGCYGEPRSGHPTTTFMCLPDGGVGTTLFHRAVAGPASVLHVDSCHQGYEPLLFEGTGSSNLVCVALCKPQSCFAGNCGSGDENRLGAAPHRCESPDAVGDFDTGSNGDQCTYLWWFERDPQNNNQPVLSRYSDAVGVCWNHSLYKYDPSGGNSPSITYPSCEQLQLHASGTDPTMPLTYFGAADLGCVDSHTAGLSFTGKPMPFRLGYQR
jgi:hypothetical protein